jgi:hypothetical protein
MNQNMQNTTEVQETETHPIIVDPALQNLYMEGQISAGEAVYWDTLAQAGTQTQDTANGQ